MKGFTVVDTHCDTVLRIEETNRGIASGGFNFNLNEALAFGGYAQFFAVWVDMKTYGHAPFNRACALIQRLKAEFAGNSGKITQVTSAGGMKDAFLQHKVAAVLSLEGAEALQGRIENLRHFYDLGVRCVSLTWNYRNEFADGALSPSRRGLTQRGRELVREINRLGMLLDVSHLSERCFWQVMEETGAPVMASHSCSAAVRPHRRNLTDSQFKAIAQSGGVVGLNFFSRFLTKRKNAYLEDIIRHFEHFLSLSGEDAVGIGSDFDGASAYPENVLSTAGIYALLKELSQRGYPDKVLRKFASGNMISLMDKVLH